MSQTPAEASATDNLSGYDNAWAALNQMIREGKPFSGHERNCAFLNLGSNSEKFANISAAAGLDFDDDGRGLALSDWDMDGDLDFLVTNRTAPRIRFLRNDSPHPDSARWVAFTLQGTESNRDAIGARLEVHFPDGSKHIKSLSAGHSHLSQSTKWLHVGIGDHPSISKVVVRWPGTSSQEFSGCTPGTRYKLTEGQSAPVEWEAPSTGPALAAATTTGNPDSDAGRIVVLDPPIMPRLEASTLDNEPIDLNSPGKPVLVNLWATWCVPCVAELKEWAAAREELESAGLDIVSLSVDEPSGDPAADRKKINAFIKKLDYPFTVGLPSEKLPDVLDTVQLALIGRQTPLPIPSSFLLDSDRQVAVIYRGPVSTSQLLADMRLLGSGEEAILAGALPFPGIWLDKPRPTGAAHIAGTFTRKGDLRGAIDYQEHVLSRAGSGTGTTDEKLKSTLLRVSAAAHYDLKEFADSLEKWQQLASQESPDRSVFLEISRCHAALGKIEEAAAAMEKVLELKRDDPENLVQLSQFRYQLGDKAAAIALIDEAMAIRPSENPSLLFHYATLLVSVKRVSDACTALRSALQIENDWPPAANNLAWILATSPQEELRDPVEALRLAKIAADASDHKLASAMGTLAASYAANGQFDKAVEAAQKALSLAKTQYADTPARIEQFSAPLSSYTQNKPYRDRSLAPGS